MYFEAQEINPFEKKYRFTIEAIIFDSSRLFLFVETILLHFANYFAITDIQILPFEMSRCLQKEEESQKGQMDQSLQKDRWQRIGGGSSVRIRKEKKHTRQI